MKKYIPSQICLIENYTLGFYDRLKTESDTLEAKLLKKTFGNPDSIGYPNAVEQDTVLRKVDSKWSDALTKRRRSNKKYLGIQDSAKVIVKAQKVVAADDFPWLEGFAEAALFTFGKRRAAKSSEPVAKTIEFYKSISPLLTLDVQKALKQFLTLLFPKTQTTTSLL